METERSNNWHKGLRRYTVPPIHAADGSMAITNEDKAHAFLHSFFPPPPTVETPEYSILDNPGSRDFHDVTRSKVECNLKSSSQTSPPGSSGISFRALGWAWEAAPEVIHYIVRWSIRLGFHHPDWKSAVMVVLPKPHKPDYAAPRAYRPIQLLECLGKLVEKIVARRLMFDCAKHSLMPPEQFGGVMAALCIDAGLSLTHDIESALRRGHTASLLTVDVKGFFDNVNHKQLVSTTTWAPLQNFPPASLRVRQSPPFSPSSIRPLSSDPSPSHRLFPLSYCARLQFVRTSTTLVSWPLEQIRKTRLLPSANP